MLHSHPVTHQHRSRADRPCCHWTLLGSTGTIHTFIHIAWVAAATVSFLVAELHGSTFGPATLSQRTAARPAHAHSRSSPQRASP